jgi:hypothetical protein
MRFMLMAKKWKACAKKKRSEGVSKALDMLGACNISDMSHIFTKETLFSHTHLHKRCITKGWTNKRKSVSPEII